MEMFIIASTFDVIGKILIGLSVLLVHQRLLHERRVDKRVLTEMEHEQILVIIGIVSMVIGYAMHVGLVN